MGKKKAKCRSNPQNRHHNPWSSYKRSHSHNHDNSSSCSRTNVDQESDIPGYYYDSEKKTYFKILPYHLGAGGNFVTKETIDRAGRKDGKHIQGRSGSTSGVTSKLSQSIYLTQIGHLSRNVFKRRVMLQKLNSMHASLSWSSTCVTLPNFGVRLEALQKMELNSNHDKAVCVWSVEGEMSQKIHLMSISYNNQSKTFCENGGSCPIKMEPSQSYSVTCSSKITSLCWSPLTSHPGTLCVLYTAVFPLGDFNSKVSISNLQARERERVNVFDFSLGRGAVWASAWNRFQNRFSVGCERKCQVVDVCARRQWVYSTCNSDALSQLFSNENPHTLYSGTRSGFILIHDLRSVGTSKFSAKLNQRMPVMCIRSRQDENYIVASDFSGSICSWDLRMQKIVMKYSGLSNSHYFLPFYLDETDQYLYGTGSDSICKVWDLATGNVVTAIPPPILDVSPDCLSTFPITHLSGRWTGYDGIFGAITGMGRKFYLSF